MAAFALAVAWSAAVLNAVLAASVAVSRFSRVIARSASVVVAFFAALKSAVVFASVAFRSARALLWAELRSLVALATASLCAWGGCKRRQVGQPHGFKGRIVGRAVRSALPNKASHAPRVSAGAYGMARACRRQTTRAAMAAPMGAASNGRPAGFRKAPKMPQRPPPA